MMWRSDSTSDPGPLAAVSQAFAIFPALMQLVHTRIRFGAPFTRAFTACRFTFHRRRVTLCACEMLFPNCGPLPQMSHTCAIVPLQDSLVFRAASAVPGASCAAQSFGHGNRWHAQERVPVGLPNSQYTVNPPPSQGDHFSSDIAFDASPGCECQQMSLRLQIISRLRSTMKLFRRLRKLASPIQFR